MLTGESESEQDTQDSPLGSVEKFLWGAPIITTREAVPFDNQYVLHARKALREREAASTSAHFITTPSSL